MSDSQVLNSETLDESNLGKQFIAYVDTIMNALGITDDVMKKKIEEEMRNFDKKSKYKIISDSELQTNVKRLIDADEKLQKLVNEEGILHSFYTKNIENKQAWDESMEQVARLQGLIILRKISHNDCDGLIKSLLGAFDTKLQAVNELLSSDLKADKDGKQTTSPVQDKPLSDQDQDQQFGGSDYLVKYLKYKNKYLKLLKNNM